MAGDPTTALASSIHMLPGAYALLIGSGVSRSAGLMTGWEIALDLVQRIAIAETGQPTTDPATWYREHHEEDVDYSRVLEQLAPSLADRQALLNSYFEPTDDEREQGRKLPTSAHRAIAALVRVGAVKVIVTTNFDRLIERALQDEGVEPLIVASAADARAAPPLHSIRCLVVKVHGDRMSPNLRNTLTELESYDEDLEDLVAGILRDYGLIVCGWSADWDAALRALVSNHEPKVFSTFWAHRGDPSPVAQRLIKQRAAIPMSIEDADTFFDTISRKVQALIEISSHAPSSLAIRLAELKRYLTDPVHRVRLHELVLEDVERVIAETGLDRFPLEGHFVEADLVTRLSLMEEATLPLVAILATLAFYADDARHDDLLVRAMERLSKRDIQHAGKTVMLAAQWYPALLSLYAIALGSLAASRPQPYVRALNLSVANPFGAPLSLAYQLAPLQVVARDAVARTPEFFRHKTPVSDLLHARLGPAVSSFVPSEATYDTCFDYAEYLHGIAVMDSGVGWAPFGRFIWRRARNEYNPPDAVLARYERELLEAGLCQGSKARLDEVHAQYASFLSTIPLF